MCLGFWEFVCTGRLVIGLQGFPSAHLPEAKSAAFGGGERGVYRQSVGYVGYDEGDMRVYRIVVDGARGERRRLFGWRSKTRWEVEDMQLHRVSLTREQKSVASLKRKEKGSEFNYRRTMAPDSALRRESDDSRCHGGWWCEKREKDVNPCFCCLNVFCHR